MKRLYRSRKNRVLAGICGGIGEYYNVDPVLIRIIAVFLTLFLGFPLLVYLVAIFVIPEEPLGATAATAATSEAFNMQQPQQQSQMQPPAAAVKHGMPM